MFNHVNRSKGRTGIPPSNPTPEQIREIRALAGLTQTEAAGMVYVALRSWQKWEDSTGGDSARTMPAAAWALFLIRVRTRARCALPAPLAEFVGRILDESGE